jgi:hypothetical protein
MVGHIAALVDVAKHQAELTQAIFRSNEATLAYSIKAGEEARASTALAGKSLQLTRLAVLIAIVSSILSAIIGVAVPVYLNDRNAKVNEQSTREERALREREVHTLNEISLQLAADAKARSGAAGQDSLKRQIAPLKGQPKAPR